MISCFFLCVYIGVSVCVCLGVIVSYLSVSWLNSFETVLGSLYVGGV